ncbi:heavy metal sensor histidine kinase [Aurantiacibacter flavus]|uniref:Sensor protein n=1 Tax=Aurantiacibacter flavus TaxID=3145232 RepID=A0ABV0CZY5_9SPHN
MIRTRSISFRLAIMFGLATAVVSLVASAGLFMQQSAEFRRHSLEELRGRYVIVERMATFNENHAEWQHLTRKLADFEATQRGLHFVTDSDDPRFRFGSSTLVQAEFARARDGHDTVEFDGRTYSTFAGPIPPGGQRPQTRLIIALDQQPLRQARNALALGIGVTTLLTIIAVSALGWWIARRGLRSADELSSHARRLGEGDLALRLPTKGLPSELEGLVLSFNDALDRLHRSHQKLADFNADVAHELRTPLTNLIGETELALTRERSQEDLAQVLRSNLEELDRLRSIINDMLFLARSDAGDVVSNLTLVDLATESSRTITFMEVLFEENRATVSVEGDARCWVERALFGRALTNLLDNAIRHGKAGGHVSVRIEPSKEAVSVSVTSEGGPIPQASLSRVFDRFYCADPARRSNGSTHGLGLAIVKAVARMHGGMVRAENGDGTVTVGFTIARHLGADTHGGEPGKPDRPATVDCSTLRTERSRPGNSRQLIEFAIERVLSARRLSFLSGVALASDAGFARHLHYANGAHL